MNTSKPEKAAAKLAQWITENTPEEASLVREEETVRVGLDRVDEPDEIITDIRMAADRISANLGVHFDGETLSGHLETGGYDPLLIVEFSEEQPMIHPGIVEAISDVEHCQARLVDGSSAVEIRWTEEYDVEKAFEYLAVRNIYPSEVKWSEKAVICRRYGGDEE